MMTQKSEKICPTCLCAGREVRKITHPMSNVAGWRLIDWQNHVYDRHCVRCNGTGFVPMGTSVPTISVKPESK